DLRQITGDNDLANLEREIVDLNQIFEVVDYLQGRLAKVALDSEERKTPRRARKRIRANSACLTLKCPVSGICEFAAFVGPLKVPVSINRVFGADGVIPGDGALFEGRIKKARGDDHLCWKGFGVERSNHRVQLPDQKPHMRNMSGSWASDRTWKECSTM